MDALNVSLGLSETDVKIQSMRALTEEFRPAHRPRTVPPRLRRERAHAARLDLTSRPCGVGAAMCRMLGNRGRKSGERLQAPVSIRLSPRVPFAPTTERRLRLVAAEPFGCGITVVHFEPKRS
ncbi:hypothetical protein NE236_40785 [Actinoallomurus purpureus]|uniref:hypothetical protein n=1 Tax=Actinoallomurus purpureus TaxID=478114 RepID=UPI0020934B38|nr:hypothetical protein [Actinoallomurus purpureus]MCO6011305.1 hypothetical protein [Actinoallomurus purpureus]